MKDSTINQTRIGMMIAVEVEAFIHAFQGEYQKSKIHGFDVYKVTFDSIEVFAIHSMAGQVFASAATMLLINEFDVDVIINYGTVGSLTDEIKTYDKCVVDKIVHYNFDKSAADDCEVGKHEAYNDIYIRTSKKLLEIAHGVDKDLKTLCCASGDKFVDDAEEKRLLNKKFNAQICEMEAAGIVLIADRAKVPCLMIKVVSDSISGGAGEYHKTMYDCSEVCMKIIKNIIYYFDPIEFKKC